ncbi:hypothetical protein WJX73_001798 [Symbiochloris irregularis]|uniref:Uncharacterized protein n=1 Tax=Symbiochloris irregularis TaxID=706552 RepID=A0AAW1P1C7_9CHLO
MGKKSRRRDKGPELAWPEMSREDHINLLQQMRIDQLFVGQADLSRLTKLLDRALSVSQQLHGSLSRIDDPSALPRWGKLDSDFQEAFRASLYSRGEVLMFGAPPAYGSDVQDTAWRNFRIMHLVIADKLLAGKPPTFCMGDESQDLRVVIIVKGVRRTRSGHPLLEVMFASILGDRRAKGLREMQALMLPYTGGSGIPFTASAGTLCVLLMKQKLEANAARLAPEYLQRCRHEWGMQDALHAQVSFIVPHCALDPDQVESVRTCCANGDCCQATSSQCSRCQIARVLESTASPPNIHGTQRFVVTVQLGHVHKDAQQNLIEDTIAEVLTSL